MRQIKYIVLHCVAGPLHQTVDSVISYWRKSLGWRGNGYHHLITSDGIDNYITPIEQIANGVHGYNKESIHISTTGGIDSDGRPVDNRTAKQKQTEAALVKKYKKRFPNAVVLGHRDFSTDINGNGKLEEWEFIKFCPCYDTRDWLETIGLGPVIKPSRIVYKLNYPLIKDSKAKEIQIALNIAGANLKEDGVFGKDTHDAVVAFQEARRLTSDGIVGPRTASQLNIKL